MARDDDGMLIGPPAGLEGEQSRMNQSTRGQWDWYASHRRAIERLIVPEVRGGRICVLGAGNCNDLDLNWLAEAYAEVHLVDIDRAALERAAARQRASGRVQLHAPVDLIGIAGMTGAWKGRGVSEADVETAIRAVGEPSEPIAGGGFDVVLSPCVLSQLLVGVREVIGKDHVGWPRLKEAIRARHLRTVVDLAQPGGRGVMAVDLASSGRLPGLDRAREDDLPNLMRMCVREGKGFRGLEPADLNGVFRRGGGVADVAVHRPWLWHLGFGKAFLCYGMVVKCVDRTVGAVPGIALDGAGGTAGKPAR